MAPTLMQPLREEHAGLLPHVEALRAAGDAVGFTDLDTLRDQVERSFDFLIDHLIPHATAEDEALYPVVQRAMGAPEATATMSRDHVEVDRFTHELVELREALAATDHLADDAARDLRRVLYGLYALVKVHFAKEEELYLPLLDARLSADEAAEMFAAMATAAGAPHDH